MAEPRADAARTYLERVLGVQTTRRRRRPIVDVTIDRARVDPVANTPEEEAALAAFDPAPTHGDYSQRDLRVSPEENAARGEASRAAEERRVAEQARRMDPETVRGTVRAGLPDIVPDAVSDAIASTPLAAWFDPDIGAALEHGARQGLTLGHEDEIAGLVRGGGSIPAYRRERDRVRAEQDEAQRNAPWAYGAAEALGSMPLAAVVPSPAPGAGLLARLGGAGLGGAGFGAVSGLGHSRAEIDDPRLLADMRRDAGIGALTGIGMEGVISLGRGLIEPNLPPPEGTPAPGADFTPEQQAQIRARRDTDPELWEMNRRRDIAEEAAANRRVRSTADSAVLSDVRRAGDYSGPGGEGYRGLARDLDATGIQPRRSLDSASDAQLRAARVREEAGEALGNVRAQMREQAARGRGSLDEPIITNSPDELAAIHARGMEEEAARRATAREIDAAMPSQRDPRVQAELDAFDASTPDWYQNRASPADRAAVETFQPGYGRSLLEDTAPVGRRRLRGTTPQERARPPVNDPGYEPVAPEDARQSVLEATSGMRYQGDARVGYGGAAERLRAEADRLARESVTSAQDAEVAQLRELADRLESRGADSFDASVGVLRGLDREAGYGRRYPNAPDAGTRVEIARQGRRAVRGAMDESVGDTLGSDVLAEYRRQRGRFGTAEAVDKLSQRGAEREGSNLQFGLGDTLAVQSAMGQQAPITSRLMNAIEGVVVNRYLRGRAHAIIATGREMQSDALAAAITRRLTQTPEGAAAARALTAAQARGPRAYGLVLMRLAQRDPAVQEALAQEVSATPDWQSMGLPTADDTYDDTQDQPDWGRLGLPTADDEEEAN